MVVIHLKRAEESQFLVEIPVATKNQDICALLGKLYTDRKRLARLVQATEGLLKYGPMKPISDHGYSEEQMETLSTPQGQSEALKIEVNMNGFTFYETIDPLGQRTGLEAGQNAQQVINSALNDARKIIGLDYHATKELLTPQILQTCFENIKGALTIVYPQGLPDWDPVTTAIQNNEDLEGSAASKDVFLASDTSLWWAGKELQKDKLLSDYCGKNEKTKLIVKIQRSGQGPPAREQYLSEQEQKNMMAYYYKKQEELKRLEENEEDDYLNSSWADPKSLKSNFNGIGNVKFTMK